MNKTFNVRVNLGTTSKVFAHVGEVNVNGSGHLLIYKADHLVAMFATGQWTYWELI